MTLPSASLLLSRLSESPVIFASLQPHWRSSRLRVSFFEATNPCPPHDLKGSTQQSTEAARLWTRRTQGGRDIGLQVQETRPPPPRRRYLLGPPVSLVLRQNSWTASGLRRSYTRSRNAPRYQGSRPRSSGTLSLPKDDISQRSFRTSLFA